MFSHFDCLPDGLLTSLFFSHSCLTTVFSVVIYCLASSHSLTYHSITCHLKDYMRIIDKWNDELLINNSHFIYHITYYSWRTNISLSFTHCRSNTPISYSRSVDTTRRLYASIMFPSLRILSIGLVLTKCNGCKSLTSGTPEN